MQSKLLSIKNKVLKSHLTFLLLILVLNLILNLININKFFPVSEGWFQQYAALILEGQVVYRDFYLFVPPGFVFLITALQGVFGTYYIVFRIYGLLERLLLITLVYFILKRFFKPKTIFITLSAAAAISVTNAQDLLYGYYQTCLLLAFLCLFFMLKLYDNYDNTHKRILYAIVLGICCGVSIMFKQTMGVFVPFVLLVISMLTMLKKDKKKYLITLSYILGAFLISILPVIIYLAVNQAFVPFIEQVFLNSTSKGSIFHVLFGFIIKEFTVRFGYSIITFLLFTIVFTVLCFMRESKCKKRLVLGVRYTAIFLIFLMLFEPLMSPRPDFMYFETLLPHADEKYAPVFLITTISIVTIASVFIIKTKLYEKSFFHQSLSFVLFLSIVGCFVFIALNPTLIVRYDSFNRFCFVIFLILLVLCIYHLRLALKTKSKESVKFLFACGVAVAIMYTHAMSGLFEPHCLILPFTLVVGLILENDIFNVKNKAFFFCLPPKECIATEADIDDRQADDTIAIANKNAGQKSLKESRTVSLSVAIKNIMIGFVCMLLIVSAGQKKAYVTYNWWGIALPSIYDAKYKADDKSLSGFTLPESTVNMLNSIKKTVDLNKKDGDTMYTFSHINYFNVMSGMDSTTFAKVHYFDVCPDDLAIADAKRLIENKNSFIIWQDFTDYEWQFHEDYFRSGNPSGQRKIKEAINILFTDGSYIFAGEFKDRESNPIQVWVINDGRPIYNFMGERII